MPIPFLETGSCSFFLWTFFSTSVVQQDITSFNSSNVFDLTVFHQDTRTRPLFYRCFRYWQCCRSSSLEQPGQRVLQECLHRSQCWLTSISVTIRLDPVLQKSLQECWVSAQRSLTDLNLEDNGIETVWTQGITGVLDQCRTLTHLDLESNVIGSSGSERLRPSTVLRGVFKPLVFFCRHLVLLVCCHLSNRQSTRNIDLLYTYSVLAFGLVISLGPKGTDPHTTDET